jgi:hypothetical protein
MAAKGYWREISAVLVAKTIGIVLLYCLVTATFGPADITPASVALHLAPANILQAR